MAIKDIWPDGDEPKTIILAAIALAIVLCTLIVCCTVYNVALLEKYPS